MQDDHLMDMVDTGRHEYVHIQCDDHDDTTHKLCAPKFVWKALQNIQMQSW
jgi:hypothetical protein